MLPAVLKVVDQVSGTQSWRLVFAAILDHDWNLYRVPPTSAEEWSKPMNEHRLICTRLVHSGAPNAERKTNFYTFTTRTGTRLGVEGHVMRVETQQDSSMWTRAIVEGAHVSAQTLETVHISQPQFVIPLLNYNSFFDTLKNPNHSF